MRELLLDAGQEAEKQCDCWEKRNKRTEPTAALVFCQAAYNTLWSKMRILMRADLRNNNRSKFREAEVAASCRTLSGYMQKKSSKYLLKFLLNTKKDKSRKRTTKEWWVAPFSELTKDKKTFELQPAMV